MTCSGSILSNATSPLDRSRRNRQRMVSTDLLLPHACTPLAISRDERGCAAPLPLLDDSCAEKFRTYIPYDAKSLPVTYLRSRELGETCGGRGRFQAAVKASGLSACLQIPTSGPSGLMQEQGEVKRNESLKMIADSGDHGKGDESLPPQQNARDKTVVWQNAITGKGGMTRREDRPACLAAGYAFSATGWAEFAGTPGAPGGQVCIRPAEAQGRSAGSMWCKASARPPRAVTMVRTFSSIMPM